MDMSKVEDRGASFIKILGRDFCKQLQIPHDFTKTFDGYVPHRFFIESSMTKNCWRVEVEKDGDGTVYLRDGWAAFADAHGLEIGDFLLFEHEEQSIFRVKIYGRNGCQKNTSVDNECQPNPPKVVDTEEGKYEDFDSEPELIRTSGSQNKRRLSTQQCNNGIDKRQKAASMTVQRSSSVGENGTSFSVILAKEYQFLQQTIPMAVTKANKLASKTEVVLQDAEGKCWPVKIGRRTQGQTQLLRGWTHFLNAHNIALGDTLNIEFVSNELAQVQVTRSSEPSAYLNGSKCRSNGTGSFHMDAEYGTPQGDHGTKNQAVEASVTAYGNNCEHRCSSFSIVWSKSRAITHLYLPKAIAMEQNLMNKESVELHDPDGKNWPVEVKTWGDGRVALAKGWCVFLKGLDIKHGDTLDFQFVSSCVIQVNVQRQEPPNKAKPQDQEATADLKEKNVNETCSISDPLALMQEHRLLQVPPGFKPKEQSTL